MRRVFWLLALFGALVGAGALALGFLFAGGAPQQAVVAAFACAVAIIPYVWARAYERLSEPPSRPIQGPPQRRPG